MDGPYVRTALDHLVTPNGTCASRVTIDGTTYRAVFVTLANCSRNVNIRIGFLVGNDAIIDLQTKAIAFFFRSLHDTGTEPG